MALINIQNLTFAYEGSYDNVFENLSFQIDTDWRLGFVGRNGRGKTTFLSLLMGKYAHSGMISRPVSFDYFPFDIPDHSLTALEAAHSINADFAHWELLRELSLLDVAEEALCRPFATLSNGERTKLLLAVLFLRENSFLLIDEPTNHLDTAGRKKVSEYLKGKRGFIVVSHDRAFLDTCVDHVLAINRQNVEVVSGNFSTWYHNKQLRDSFEQAENERLERDIARLDAAARRAAGWSDISEKRKIGSTATGMKPYLGEQSRKMMARAKAFERRIERETEEKSALLKNIERNERLKLHPAQYHSKRLLLLDDIAINYGGNSICERISLEINRGDRVALEGKNGSGKSSIIKLIMGEDIPHTGLIRIGSGLKISYVPQDPSFLRGSLEDYARQNDIDQTLFKAILRKLDFSRVQFDKNMEDHSAGQKKKVLIAGSLCQSAHLYIWDEPLNYIDVFSRIQIEELLEGSGLTLLFVEHDSAFTERIATKRIKL